MSDTLEQELTGKLTLETSYDEQQNQFLAVYLELKQGKAASDELTQKSYDTIIDSLMNTNSEFRHLSDFLKGKVLIKVFLRPHGDPQYFPGGTKQKWIRKEIPKSQ